jgi:hypothetical protein
MGYASEGEAMDEDASVTLHDCIIERFRDVGIFGGGIARWNIMGCRVLRGADAASGGSKGGPPFHNIHGPIRLNAYNRNRVYIDGCDLFSRSGWFVNVKGWHTQQPCIRVNQGAALGSILNLQRSMMEGGYSIVALGRMSNVVNSTVQNCIVDKCVMVGSHMTLVAVGSDTGGVTLRNSLFIVPDVPRIASLFQPRALLGLGAPHNSRQAPRVPVDVAHNTLLNLLQDANSPNKNAQVKLVENDGGMTQVSTANNLLHQPGSAQAPDPGVLSKQVLWPPREQGYRDKTSQDPRYATPAGSIQYAAPVDAPDIIGNALEEPQSHFDLHGRKRPPMPSRGALEKP